MEYLTIRQLEVKAGTGKREFEGHGSIFGNVDLGRDVVLPGAFSKSLAGHRINGDFPPMYWMHQPDKVPGKWVDMAEDKDGLAVRGVLADTPLGNELHTLLHMKAVRGLSIGYATKDYDITTGGVRRLKEVDLWEVSLVSLAMNPLAQVTAMKSRLSRMGEYVPTERECENKFREMGFSKTIARACVSKLFHDDDEAGGMPGSRWDAGNVNEPDEAAEALQAAAKLMDRIGSAAIRSRF